MAYWRHGKNAFRDTEHMMIPIYRIRNVPTQFMLDNNMSQWSPGWNLTSSDPNSGLFLYDNGYPINFATLVIAFFATSAIFHFWALVAGAYEYWCANIQLEPRTLSYKRTSLLRRSIPYTLSGVGSTVKCSMLLEKRTALIVIFAPSQCGTSFHFYRFTSKGVVLSTSGSHPFDTVVFAMLVILGFLD